MRRAVHRMRPRDDRGSIAVEVAVIAPAFVVLMLLVVLAGRVSEAESQLHRAASEAARAASLRQHPSDAAHDADLVAHDNLTAAGVRCEVLTVATDLDGFRAGGRVAVTVTCVASMSDVTLLGVTSGDVVPVERGWVVHQ